MLVDIVRKHCDEVEMLSKSEAIKIYQRWLEHFANRVKDMTGKWRVKEHLWEGFSHGIQPSYLNTKALAQYVKQKPSVFYVFDESGKHCFKCKASSYPELFNTGYDLYLIPEDSSWTVVFCHDNVVYFAYPDN
jgi:hypothetical protein